MADFPRLRTGVVAQYPARRQLSFVTRVLSFVDGSEQRFRLWPGGLRRWIIRLELLTEEELAELRDFFRAHSGSAQSFRFSDPWDGIEYQDCILEADVFEALLKGEGRGDIELVVRESR